MIHLFPPSIPYDKGDNANLQYIEYIYKLQYHDQLVVVFCVVIVIYIYNYISQYFILCCRLDFFFLTLTLQISVFFYAFII